MNKAILLISLLVAINGVTLDLEAVRNDMLSRHNYYRAQHQVSDLTRVAAIESIAQNYSEYLVTLNTLKHSNNTYLGNALGENLYWGYGFSTIGTQATDAWYEEVSDYDFSNPGYKSGIGHFTQLVWKDSQQLGCGVGCGSNNYCFVTCNYYPAGNYLNQFASNVFPIAGGSTSPDTTAPDTTAPDTTAPDTTAPDTTAPDTTAPATTDPNDPLEVFRNEITARHNYYRVQHQVGNLERDDELERIAQEASEHMVEIDNFEYPTAKYNGKSIGKYLFYVWGTINANSIVDRMYQGVSSYDFSNPGYTSSAGGFTQLVWKSSQKIGCGYSCSGRECYGCCTYYPAGNMLSSFPSNVFPKAS